MQILEKILVLGLISYAQKTCFFPQVQPITQAKVIEYATKFLLSDVLHCTNINADFIDF